MKIEKLYSAMSFMDLEDRKDITVEWYYGDYNLKWSDVDYSKLIKDFYFMDNDKKLMSIDYINQLFTLDEIELVKDYLTKNCNIEVFVLEHELPVKTYYSNDNGNKRFYEAHYRYEHKENTIHLDLSEDYDLHFPVSGNYHPDDGLPAKELPEDFVDDGLVLLRDALQALRYKAKWPDEKLSKILQDIYKSKGYYVRFNSGFSLKSDKHLLST